MTEEKKEKPRGLFREIQELNLNTGTFKAPPSAASLNISEAMREGLAYDLFRDMREELDFKSEQRSMKRAEERKKAEQAIKAPTTEATINPVQEFMKGFSNAEFLATWTAMPQQTRQEVLGTIQQMAMMTPQGAAGFNAMMPYWMMQMQQKPAADIGVKDLAEMFKSGVEAARHNAPAQSNPVETFNAIMGVIKPIQDQANEATRLSFQTQIEALKSAFSKTTTIKEQIHDIKDILDVFGGSGSTNYDLEMAKINTDASMRMAQMQMQMTQWEKEAEIESRKTDGIMGLVGTVAASVAPTIAGGIKDLARQQALSSQGLKQGGAGAGVTATVEKKNYKIKCPDCKTEFLQIIDPGTHKGTINCPQCGVELELDLGQG